MRHIREELMCNIDQAIDLNSAVKELHGLGSQELNKLLRDSENFTVQHYTENGSLIQIDIERLAWSLPLHLIAVLVSPGRDEIRLRYLLRGLQLLHSLSDLASRHTRLEQILLEEVKLTEQILDLVFYILVVLARWEQEDRITSPVPLLHSALVACSLHLLTGYVSSQWQDLVHILLVHPKVDIFIGAAFDAVHADIRFLQINLSVSNSDVLCEKSSPSVEQMVHNLCLQCEASLQFLQSLCQQKLFRERLLKNKELCRNGGILILARAVLKLGIPRHIDESSKVVAAISRLKSKVLSILLQLCETESISYLDEVASSPRGMQLAKSVALEVLELLKTAFGREPKQLNVCSHNSNPRGLVLLNSMRLTDIFSDDSNFRSFITTNITGVLAEIFSLPHEEFLLSWCSTDIPVTEEDASLEYDPFVAAGVVLVSLPVAFGMSLSTSDSLNETTECPFILNNIPQASYAQQRTSFLVKIIANLHCFVPNICEEEERDLFFNKFLECLRMELPISSPSLSFASGAQKAATACENLCSLVKHAKSVIPNLLNEEDVQLLSIFFKQLKILVTPAQFEDNINQEHIQVNKSEGLPFLGKYSYINPYQEGQNLGQCTSFPMRKVFLRNQDVTLDRSNKNGDLKEGISESLTFQETNLSYDAMDLDENGKINRGTSRSASGSLREIDRDVHNAETSGSDVSSTRGKNSLDQMLDDGLAEHTEGCGFKVVFQENEKAETLPCEEKQRRKRKRNIMNDKQITLIEQALLDEPEMQRNAALLQSWADKLSVHGTELTSSQLKNWLNNRKARLARVAREARAPSEGETTLHYYDSAESPSEDYYPPTRVASNQSTQKFRGVTLRAGSSETSDVAPTDFVMNCSSLRYVQFEPGQFVSLVDGEGKEIGKGKVFQVDGRWHGKSLEEGGICVIDVLELNVERWNRLQHPSESAGTTFDEAEAKNEVMRVAWDVNKIILLPR